MRFSVALPTERVQCGDEFVSPHGVAEVARAAETNGFDACFVTDHPFPAERWLQGGGHHSLDPFVALSFAAAATATLKLHTNILVLPYRNPFLVAKSVASLDVLSGGRTIVGVAVGYLKGEFAAVGAELEGRNDYADDALHAMKLAWTADDVKFDGRGFAASGNTMRPRPLQQPHPPIWVGGNSKRAIRRAVHLGDGWSPFPNPAKLAKYSRTAVIETDDDLGKRIRLAKEERAASGRDGAFDITFSLAAFDSRKFDMAAAADRVAALESLGVTWATATFPADTRRDYIKSMEQFGRTVIGVD